MSEILYAYIKENGAYLVGSRITPQCAKITPGLVIKPAVSGQYKVEVKLRDMTNGAEIGFYSPLRQITANTEVALETESFKLRTNHTLQIVWAVIYNAQGQQIAAENPALQVSNGVIIPSSELPPDRCPEDLPVVAIAVAVIGLGGLYYFMRRSK